jgi:hypothetical protein
MIKRSMSSVMARGSARGEFGGGRRGGPHGERGCGLWHAYAKALEEGAEVLRISGHIMRRCVARIYEVRSRAGWKRRRHRR